MVDALAIFEGKTIRRHWDEARELWYFSVVDAISVMTDTSIPRRYWSDLKIQLTKEGSELYEKIVQLKLLASDGKKYFTDCADTETLFRIIQSIPSKNAEPFKLWLARVGYERVEESVDPERTINRALNTYKRQGRSDEWINQRLKSIEVRKDLTDEWDKRGVKKGLEYALLTDEISLAWAGVTTKSYKKYKSLKNENLRDNMANIELVLNMLAEAGTTEISQKQKPIGFVQNKIVAQKGGGVAKAARDKIEKETKQSVISPSRSISIDQKKLK